MSCVFSEASPTAEGSWTVVDATMTIPDLFQKTRTWALCLVLIGLILFISVALLSPALSRWGPAKHCSNALASIQVVDEHGVPVATLFEGARPLKPLANPRRERRRSPCNNTEKRSLWSNISSQLSGTVRASACPPDECAGSYISFEVRICNNSWPGCSSSTYKWHYTDPFALENVGWRYSGAWNCDPCENCEEQTCTTP